MTAKKANRIKASKLIKKTGKIPLPKETSDVEISFSFKYISTKNIKFNYKQKKSKYFVTLIDRLTSLSCMTVKEIKTSRSKSIRFNPIDFSKSTVTESGFGLNDSDDILDESYEFSISANNYGRCHGFFIGKVFFLVWLDPDHKLIKSLKHK